ncbi:MAG: CPBP family intramembrane glutamic endopeptidase [Bacteroidota bacterium]
MGRFQASLNIRYQESPWQGLLWAVTLYLFTSLVFIPIGGTLVGLFYGYGLDDVFQVLSGPNLESASDRAVFKWLQAINQLATWGLVGFLLLKVTGTLPKLLAPTSPPHPFLISFSVLAVLCMMLSIPMVQLITFDETSFSLPDSFRSLEESLEASEKLAESLLTQIISEQGTHILIMNLLVFAVVPAICEELFFRGFIQQTFQRMMSPHLAIFITACIFSLIHLQVFGLFSRIALGILLGYFTFYSSSLIPSILAHFSYNAISIIVVSYQHLNPEREEFGTSVPLYMGIISLLAVICCLFFYFRLSAMRQPDTLNS